MIAGVSSCRALLFRVYEVRCYELHEIGNIPTCVIAWF